jgi:aminoglycoside/choline kinase family phosphotransferase
MTALERLQNFLKKAGLPEDVEPLTPDASTREYFRIDWHGATAIACVYSEVFVPEEHPYLDVTNLFRTAGLPVAEVYAFDGQAGVIVHEDFGNTILRDVLMVSDEKTREDYLNRAIALIAGVQAATPRAYEMNSIASRLAFDFEKLSWELDFFTTHYFETLRHTPLSEAEGAGLKLELDDVAQELAGRARVLTHRDFHAANLMLDNARALRIIDHQDARIGTTSYDLVSLLLDRVTELPTPEWLAGKRRQFLDERERLGLEKIDEEEFTFEFRLQTIQRCLKAIGTFSYQSATRGKTYFLPYIGPMFQIVLRAAENLDKFPVLRDIISSSTPNQ